mmetsp:Transcript_33452/g.50604  ORF Transcript_33452/g.50604 Transcript_33452/m.50604 type:complete len:92 (-) Transcript_33452:92-367(-)
MASEAAKEEIEVKVLLFGPAREAADAGCLELRLPVPCTVKTLREAVGAACAPLKTLLGSSRFSLDQELVQNEDAEVTSKSEVALIPPVSGG